MILGNFPGNYEINEDKFYEWELDKFTKNEDYNRKFFEALKILPKYYEKLVLTNNIEERRVVLDEMYLDVMEKLSQRFGGLRETDALNNVVRDVEGTVKIRPHRDIEMFIYWDCIEFHDGIPYIINLFKEEQLKIYNERKSKHVLSLKK